MSPVGCINPTGRLSNVLRLVGLTCYKQFPAQRSLPSVRNILRAVVSKRNPTTVYDGVYHTITPPSGCLPSSIARQPRGCRYRTTRLRKALGEMFPTPTLHRQYSNCADVEHGKSAQRGYDMHRRIPYCCSRSACTVSLAAAAFRGCNNRCYATDSYQHEGLQQQTRLVHHAVQDRQSAKVAPIAAILING